MEAIADKERLIELLEQEKAFSRYFTNDECRERLADYLLESGVAVSPCKVGDAVYQTDGIRIYESRIKAVVYDCNTIAFDKTAIGKSIFLTREEAELALKRSGNDG